MSYKEFKYEFASIVWEIYDSRGKRIANGEVKRAGIEGKIDSQGESYIKVFSMRHGSLYVRGGHGQWYEGGNPQLRIKVSTWSDYVIFSAQIFPLL